MKSQMDSQKMRGLRSAWRLSTSLSLSLSLYTCKLPHLKINKHHTTKKNLQNTESFRWEIEWRCHMHNICICISHFVIYGISKCRIFNLSTCMSDTGRSFPSFSAHLSKVGLLSRQISLGLTKAYRFPPGFCWSLVSTPIPKKHLSKESGNRTWGDKFQRPRAFKVWKKTKIGPILEETPFCSSQFVGKPQLGHNYLACWATEDLWNHSSQKTRMMKHQHLVKISLPTIVCTVSNLLDALYCKKWFLLPLRSWLCLNLDENTIVRYCRIFAFLKFLHIFTSISFAFVALFIFNVTRLYLVLVHLSNHANAA